jgi:hypothetical protein
LGSTNRGASKMLREYKKKTNIGVGLGILVQIIGRIAIESGGDGGAVIGLVLVLVGLGLFIWGCISYSKGKGHHAAWGLLGLLSIIGLIILVLFPDRHKENKA